MIRGHPVGRKDLNIERVEKGGNRDAIKKDKGTA